MKHPRQTFWKRPLVAMALGLVLLQSPVIGLSPASAAPSAPMEYGQFLDFIGNCESSPGSCNLSRVTIDESNLTAEVVAKDEATDGKEQLFRVNLIPRFQPNLRPHQSPHGGQYRCCLPAAGGRKSAVGYFGESVHPHLAVGRVVLSISTG